MVCILLQILTCAIARLVLIFQGGKVYKRSRLQPASKVMKSMLLINISMQSNLYHLPSVCDCVMEKTNSCLLAIMLAPSPNQLCRMNTPIKGQAASQQFSNPLEQWP